MSAMAAAFEKANLTSLDGKLIQIAAEAWACHPDPLNAPDTRTDKRVQFVRSRLRQELSYVLMETNDPVALLCAIRRLLASARPMPLKQNSEIPVQPGDRFIQNVRDNHSRAAEPIDKTAPSDRADALRRMADRQANAVRGRIDAVAKLRALDMMVNGQKLRDVTVGEARRYGKKIATDTRFIEMVCGNYPDQQIVRDIVDDETADQMRARAVEMTA